MPSYAKSTPPFELDRFSEDTRRRLYDLLRTTHFFVPGLDDENSDPLPYTAADAGLAVHFIWGRWLAIWTRCEVEAYRPDAERIEILRIKPTTENDLGIVLCEC